MKTMTEEDFQDACDNDEGYCTTCEEFTRDMVEPDAEEYNCPQCEENTVCGAEQALICGLIEFRAQP
jgi:hypothetical protein